MAIFVNNYGSTGSSQALDQTPIQADPVALKHTMQIMANQMAANQHPLPPPSKIVQATIQQTLSLPYGQYVGDVQYELPHGRGTLTYRPGLKGKKYEGEWERGEFHGKGVLTTCDSRYEGEFANGKRNGQGEATFADGRTYSGEWLNDQMHGEGTIKYVTGTTYEGNWEDGKYHGQGKHMADNGDCYTGSWVKGKRTGQGKMTTPEGDYYEGSWLNDSGEGPGKWVVGGYASEGIFKNGKLWTGTRQAGGRELTYKDGVRQKECCDSCTIL